MTPKRACNHQSVSLRIETVAMIDRICDTCSPKVSRQALIASWAKRAAEFTGLDARWPDVDERSFILPGDPDHAD